MPQVSFPYTTFVDSSGEPLSNGYVLVNVNTDVQSPTGLLCAGMTLKVELDSNGIMVSVPQVWQNTDLLPADSYYVIRAYTEEGQLSSGSDKVTV